MSVTIREMRREEARRFLEVHRAAVRSLAVNDYSPAVIEAWAPPVTDARIERFLTNRDGELRLVADIRGEIVGIGAFVASASELRACYVAPTAARRGVGTAIVNEIERIARGRGLDNLTLQSSITAEPFYSALGYEVVSRGELAIAPQVRMAAVTMRKHLG